MVLVPKELTQISLIFIQYKNLSIAEHAFSMLKLAFFSLDTMTAALHLTSVRIFLLNSIK